MPTTPHATRTVLSLRTGSKVSLLVAIPLLALGIHYLLVPVMFLKGDGSGMFHCGSVLSPARGDFAASICQGITGENRVRAIAAIASGLLVPILGVALFGAERVQERALDDGASGAVGSSSDDQPGVAQSAGETTATTASQQGGRSRRGARRRASGTGEPADLGDTDADTDADETADGEEAAYSSGSRWEHEDDEDFTPFTPR